MELMVAGWYYKECGTKIVNEKFKRRKFILKIEEERNNNNKFINYITFQLTNNKVVLLNPFMEGDKIKVMFNLRGKLLEQNGQEVRSINNLDAWRVEKINN